MFSINYRFQQAMETVSEETLRRMYRRMATIRIFEQRVKALYKAKEIYGAIHLYIGQESVAVGVCAGLRDDDSVFSTFRGHGHLIAKGGDIRRMMAELMGRETGCSRGRGGSMHMFEPQIGFMGGNGIVGANLPLALGTAFSARYRGSDAVSVAFFGDGASNQGTLNESLNLAALWKLPYIAVCENNRYAATTPISHSCAVEDIAPRAHAYGMPGVIVDGNDCLAVYEAAKVAVARARSGQGPTMIECKTYRVEPHCGIIADERPDDELEKWAGTKNDPLERFRRHDVLSATAIEELTHEAEQELEEAVEFARKSAFPDVKQFLEETAEL
jgi:TPP-dependent pyruvate/acetoin dehydrogenase alpha subunit